MTNKDILNYLNPSLSPSEVFRNAIKKPTIEQKMNYLEMYLKEHPIAPHIIDGVAQIMDRYMKTNGSQSEMLEAVNLYFEKIANKFE